MGADGIEAHWAEICEVMARGKKSSMHCSVASIDPDGGPHVTPIGTIFLRDDCTGFYFDEYTTALARNVEIDPRVCVMAVDTGLGFWLRSLVTGRFAAPPGIRLYGNAGALRPATADELALVGKSVRSTQWTRGGRTLWSDLRQVRDITFTGFRPVRYPVMMSHLWTNVPST